MAPPEEEDARGPLEGPLAWPNWFFPAVAGVVLVAYALFVLGPILVVLSQGHAIAGDPSEYLLTARVGLSNAPGAYPYVFPALPSLYAAAGASRLGFAAAYNAADLLSGVLAIGVALAFGLLGYAVGRSRLSAVSSAALAGTFPAVLAEIGWGGQAQFVALISGTVAVALLVWSAPSLPSVGRSAAAGALLAFAALAEPYAAACSVLFAAAVLFLTHRLRGLSLRAILVDAIALLPPVAAVLYVDLRAGPSSPQQLGSPSLYYALGSGGLAFTENLVGLYDLGAVLGCVAIFGALAAVALLTPGLGRRAGIAFAGATVAFLGQAFVVTPEVYWTRAAIFLLLPTAVATAVLTAPHPRAASAPGPYLRRRRWVRRPSRRQGHVIRAAAAAVALSLIAVQLAVDLGGYPGDLTNNEFSRGDLANLTWLRGETGGVLLVAPESLDFPIAFATERPLYPAVQPYWFDTSVERSSAEFASTVLDGSQWIQAGPVELVENGPPGGLSLPTVLVAQSPYLVPLATLTAEEGGTYAQSDRAPATPSPPTLAPGLNSVPQVAGSTRLPTYNLTSLGSVADGAVSLALSFVASGGAGGPLSVGLSFAGVSLSTPVVYGTNASVTATYQEPGEIGVQLPLSLWASGGPGVLVSAPTVVGAPSGPELVWSLVPDEPEFNVSINVTLPQLAAAVPSLVSEASALTSHGVGWVVVDSTTNASALDRFTDDPLFAADGSTNSFAVFRVV